MTTIYHNISYAESSIWQNSETLAITIANSEATIRTDCAATSRISENNAWRIRVCFLAVPALLNGFGADVFGDEQVAVADGFIVLGPSDKA